jgi:C-terminal processing protease CtpA/Prc
LFDHEVRIADRIERKQSEPVLSKKQTPPYLGPLYILVDSDSGSGAELLARIAQIEHRGTVIGDHTAGAVMEATEEPEHLGYYDGNQVGFGTGIVYGFSITTADLVMSDGQRLEGKGVQPDQLLFPTAQDLAEGKDPVMAKATELAGDPMTPDRAGKLFPFEWDKLF